MASDTTVSGCYLRIRMMRTMRTPKYCPQIFLSGLTVHAASNEQTGQQGTSTGPQFTMNKLMIPSDELDNFINKKHLLNVCGKVA